MELKRFIDELKGRGVYRVTVIYAAGAWAILQFADIVFPALGLPDWSITALLVAASVGFPVALVLAWLFDLTPQGIVSADETTAQRRQIQWSPSHFIEFTLIVMLALLVGYLYFDRLMHQQAGGSGTGADAPERASVAVMPFVNMSENAAMGYVGDGLAEEILNLLARINELNVAARTSSFYFKDKNADIRTIGKNLGVQHVLEGSVRYDGGRVRVTAQLIDARDGFHVWSETYDRELKDVLDLESEIARKVTDSLQVLLSAESRDTLSRFSVVDPLAYDYYLRGREYLRLPKDESNLRGAVDMFDKVVAKNPGFAEAYAGLCDARLGLYDIGSSEEDFEAAEAACHRALTLDQRAATVYIALGNLYRNAGQYDQALDEFNAALALNQGSPDAYLGLGDAQMDRGQPTLAEQSYREAIRLQPNYWRALMSMAGFLYLTGRYEEAIPYFRRITEFMPDSESALNNMGAAYFASGEFDQASIAWKQSLELAPSAKAYSNLATSLFFLERFDEAVTLYHKAVELAPEDYELWGNLGDAYRLAGGSDGIGEIARSMYRNAIKLAGHRLEINASDAETLALLGHYHAMLGERDEALDFIARSTELAPDNMYVSYSAATAYAALGETDRAVEALERSLKSGYPVHIALADANLRGVREMARFEAIDARPE